MLRGLNYITFSITSQFCGFIILEVLYISGFVFHIIYAYEISNKMPGAGTYTSQLLTSIHKEIQNKV